MFDVFLQVFMGLIAVVAYYSYKKVGTEKQILSAFALGLVALVLAALAQGEIGIRTIFPIGVTPVLPQLLLSAFIPAAWEVYVYAIFAMLSGMIFYAIGYLVAGLHHIITGIYK